MPEYEISNENVKVTLIGKVLDMDYAKVLVRNPNLSLHEIMLLDKIQKRKELTDDEIHHLKGQRLIEGRKPNFHISLNVAEKTDQLAAYIKNRGFKDQHYKDLILEFIAKHGSASKAEIDGLILDILPSVLSYQQKINKVRNLIYSMSKRDGTIINQGTIRYPKWIATTYELGNFRSDGGHI